MQKQQFTLVPYPPYEDRYAQIRQWCSLCLQLHLETVESSYCCHHALTQQSNNLSQSYYVQAHLQMCHYSVHPTCILSYSKFAFFRVFFYSIQDHYIPSMLYVLVFIVIHIVCRRSCRSFQHGFVVFYFISAWKFS